MTALTEEQRESKRSLVRITVTYAATAFLFGIGAIMIAILLWKNKYGEAKDVFLTILPVSSAVISFWFAGRSPKAPVPGGSVSGGSNN